MQLSAESSTVERGVLPMLSLPRLLALQPLLLLLLENPRSSLSKEQEKDCPPARQNHVEVRIKGGGVAVEEVVNRGYVRDPETRGQTRGVGGEGGCVPVVLRGGHGARIRAIELAISMQFWQTTSRTGKSTGRARTNDGTVVCPGSPRCLELVPGTRYGTVTDQTVS